MAKYDEKLNDKNRLEMDKTNTKYVYNITLVATILLLFYVVIYGIVAVSSDKGMDNYDTLLLIYLIALPVFFGLFVCSNIFRKKEFFKHRAVQILYFSLTASALLLACALGLRKKDNYCVMLPLFMTILPIAFLEKKYKFLIANILASVFYLIMSYFATNRNNEIIITDAQNLLTAIVLSYVVSKVIIIYQLDSIKNRNILESLSVIDELTKIPNRRMLDQYILDLSNGHKNVHCSIMMCDIDDFKEINDRYGHAMGDYVLIELGQILNNIMLSSNKKIICYRYGGEEFAILSESINLNDLYQFAILIQNEFTRVGEKKNLRTTISIGIASTEQGLENYEQVMEKADKSLYEAKENGKNKIVIYNNKIK